MNKIEKLVREDGSICQSWEDNRSEVQDFYRALYMSQGYRSMEELLNLIPTRVTPEMNENFDKLFTPDEVRVALFQMAPSKARGVMVFRRGFFSGTGIYLKEILCQQY